MSITKLKIAPGYFFVKWGSGMSIMGPDWGRWKGRAGRAGAALRAVSLGLLAAALAVHAVRAGREGSELERRSGALAREIERVGLENRALRDELRALEGDPVYVESLLRRWRMAAPGERVVE